MLNISKMGKPPYFLRLITPVSLSRKKNLKPLNQRAVFIISTGRTGTNFFAKYLNTNKNVLAVHEPKPSRILKMWSNARMEGLVDDSDMAKVLLSKRRKIARTTGSRTYIESNPYVIGFINAFGKVFKKLTIIYVIRDPRHYIKSSINHGNSKGIKRFLNDHLPYWYVNLTGDAGYITDSFDLKVASYWTTLNEWALKQGEKSNDFHVFKFEEIFSKSGKKFSELINTMGLEPNDYEQDKKAKNQSKHNTYQSWYKWSDIRCYQIDQICGDLMRKYGYGNEKEWKEKVRSGKEKTRAS